MPSVTLIYCFSIQGPGMLIRIRISIFLAPVYVQNFIPAVLFLKSIYFSYLLRKMKNAGLLTPVVIKGRGAKYKAKVAPGTEVAIEE